ncbi:MAG: EamA family transporter [Ilumatobacteraceae bacterium]
MNRVSTPTPQRAVARSAGGFSPESVFVLAGVSQNIGSILAKSLFDEVRPATVALIRVMFASVVLLALSWRHWVPSITGRTPSGVRRWTRADLGSSALFGVSIALMNLFFFLAIDRLDLGKGAAIEFIGPIAVAASRTRTRRNAIAILMAVIGVGLLSGFEVSGNPLGLLFIFLASAMWAVYIVIGAKVARQDRGLAGLGVGLIFGSVAIAPVGIGLFGDGVNGDGSIAAVLSSPKLLVLCCAVGLFTTVIGYGLDQHVLRRIPTARFALLLALLPVNATLVAFIALNERPSVFDLIGIAFVVAGVILQQRDEPPSVLDEPPQ